MKRMAAILLITTFLIQICSDLAFAADIAVFELNAIEVQQETCILSGRAFTANSSLMVSMQMPGATASTSRTFSDDKGYFSVSVPLSSFALSTLTVVDARGNSQSVVLDFSPAQGVFTIANGYTVKTVTYTPEATLIKGVHTGTADGAVTMRLMQENAIVKGIAQAISNENKDFTLKFKVAPGDYTLYLRAEGLPIQSCTYTEGSMRALLVRRVGDFDAFKTKIGNYAAIIEGMIADCRQEGMTTQYEDANLAILKKYIELVEKEAIAGDYTRMNEYEYALTRIYNDTVTNLQQYLSGEKDPFRVHRYVTSDLGFDGVSTIATVDDGTEQPTFFTGFMSIDFGAAEHMSFLEEIGINAMQIGTNTYDMIRSYDPHIVREWSLWQHGNNAVTAAVTDETAKSGSYSLKLTNPNDYVADTYKEFRQFIPVKPNTTYEWGFSAKGTDIHTCWFGLDGRVGKGYQYIDTNLNSWKNYTRTYTTGKKQEWIEYAFACEGKTGALYLDDLYLREQGTTTNLLANPGFEDRTERVKTAGDLLGETYGWYMDYGSNHASKLKYYLKQAEKRNMLVDVMVPINYVPKMVYDQDATMDDSATQFMPFTLDSQVTRDFCSFLAQVIGTISKDYDSVKSICLSNEPLVNGSGYDLQGNVSDHYLDSWHTWLNGTYGGNISALNKAYGLDTTFNQISDKGYDGFEDVPFPSYEDRSAHYYDYIQFNDSLMNDFFDWYAGEMKKFYPEMPIHIKLMDYFRYNYRHYVWGGTNWEILADSFDINGCDAHSYLGYQQYTPLTMKMGWYDYMTSVKEAPVFDTESHILEDARTVSYSDTITRYYESDVWNGAVHGRSADILWLFDADTSRNAVGGSNYANANLVHRPAEMAAIARTGLDLQRLSKEITALQKAETRTALLYSRTSLSWDDNYMSKVGEAYEDLLFSGQKVAMITDEEPERMQNYQLLVVPYANYVPTETLNEITTYLNNGGKVLLLGENSLAYDPYGKAHAASTVNYIRQNADSQSAVREMVTKLALSNVVLTDANGDAIDGVEWGYAKYNGQYLVNILNYDFGTEKALKLFCNGKEVTTFRELRSGDITDTLVAEHYKPMLIAFDDFSLDLIDHQGNVIEKNVATLKTGTYRVNTYTQGEGILALYQDNVLAKMSIRSGTLVVPALTEGSWRLMATCWNMETLEPQTDAKILTLEVE